MTKMKRLQNEAMEACKFRGHKMGKWQRDEYWKETVTYSHCSNCNKQVVVDTHPMPNGIDICGEAVALSCKD
jgi:hypothetical protein